VGVCRDDSKIGGSNSSQEQPYPFPAPPHPTAKNSKRKKKQRVGTHVITLATYPPLGSWKVGTLNYCSREVTWFGWLELLVLDHG